MPEFSLEEQFFGTSIAAKEAPEEGVKATAKKTAEPEQVLPNVPALPRIPFSPAKGNNWAAMFVAFSEGVELADIAREFDIELKTLQNHAAANKWRMLAERRPPRLEKLMAGTHEAEKLTRLLENRETNFRHFSRLREHLDTQITALLEGRLQITEIKSSKTGIEEMTRDPNPKELLELANYAKVVIQGTYDALGDVPQGGMPESPQAAVKKLGKGPQAQLFVAFPAVMQRPRDPVEEAGPANAREVTSADDETGDEPA